jgi:hypothetical protein
VAEFVCECGEIDLGYARGVAGDGGFDVEVHFRDLGAKLRLWVLRVWKVTFGVKVQGSEGSYISLRL